MEKIVLPYNEGLQKEIKEIGLELQGEQNIMVVNSMGPTAYKRSYGATYSAIRRIAQPYVGNEVLAKCMWGIGYRETMILATLIYPADHFTREQALQWVGEMPCPELVEYACRNLYARLPYADSLISDLLTQNQSFSLEMTYLLAARLVEADTLSARNVAMLLDSASQNVSLARGSLSNAVSVFLKQAGVHAPYRSRVTALADAFSASDNMQARWVAEEVRTFITYMPAKD